VDGGGFPTARVGIERAMKWRTLLPILIAIAFLGACLNAIPIVGAAAEPGFSEAQPGTQENLHVRAYHLVLVGHPTVARVSLFLEQEVPKADVLVEELEGRPTGAAEPPALVRAYVSIDAGEARVENAVIEFKVPRSWVELNNIDERTIELLRLNSEWRRLPTRPTRSTDLYFYFEAETPGFSVFAVVGQSKGSREPVAGPPLALYAVLMIAVAGGVPAVYWFLTRPMKPFVSLGQLKRAIARRKRGRAGMGEPEMLATLRRLRRATKLEGVPKAPVEELGRARTVKKRRGEKDIKLLRRLRRKMERG